MGVIIISVLYLIVGLVLAIQSTYNATIEDDSRSNIVKFGANTEIKILNSNLESVRTFLKLVCVHKAVKTSGECCQVVDEDFRLQLHCFWRRQHRYR